MQKSQKTFLFGSLLISYRSNTMNASMKLKLFCPFGAALHHYLPSLQRLALKRTATSCLNALCHVSFSLGLLSLHTNAENHGTISWDMMRSTRCVWDIGWPSRWMRCGFVFRACRWLLLTNESRREHVIHGCTYVHDSYKPPQTLDEQFIHSFIHITAQKKESFLLEVSGFVFTSVTFETVKTVHWYCHPYLNTGKHVHCHGHRRTSVHLQSPRMQTHNPADLLYTHTWRLKSVNAQMADREMGLFFSSSLFYEKKKALRLLKLGST